MAMKISLLVLFALIFGASAFQNLSPRFVRHSTIVSAEATAGRRSFVAGLGVAFVATQPALALKSVLSEEEQASLEAAQSGKKERPPAWKDRDDVREAKDPFEPPDRPKKKLKWQDGPSEPEAVDNGALEAARQKRDEKKAAAAEKIKSRKRNCTAMEEMQGKCK